MKKPKEKPKYHVGQNLLFLTKSAWRLEKGIILLPVLLEIVLLLQQLTELLIAPIILAKVEAAAGLGELLLTIGSFTGMLIVLAGAAGFLEQMASQGEGRLRLHFCQLVGYRACVTSYENVIDKNYREKLSQAEEEVNYRKSATHLFDDFVHLSGAFAGFIIYLLLLSKVSFVLIAVVTITAFIGYFMNRRVNRWDFEHREETAEYVHCMNYVENVVMGNEMGKDIRIFGLGNWLRDLYDSAMHLYHSFVKRREKKYRAVNLLNVLFTVLRNGVAYGYLLQMVFYEEISVSEFLLLFTAVSGFTVWITKILENLALLHKRSLGLCKVRELFDWEEPFLLEGGEPLVYQPGETYELCLENVTYRYPEAEKATLAGINLTLHPGEKLAIVGLNGAGKTTLVKLFCGFLNPQEGRVLLNGQDIRKYNRRDYYRLFAAVFQDFSELSTTIAENVAQSEEMDRERVKVCLEKAGLGKLMAELPKGMDTHYGKAIYDDGIELSGGQTQRLMLARALYKQAPVLVLDEPTAALDPIAENDIYMKYNEMSEGRSSIFISHRLASTRFCDRILFLSDGAIAEEGTHEELMHQNQGYAKLFEVQSRYYQEESKEAKEDWHGESK